MITQLPQGLYFSRVKQSVHRGICFFFLLSFFPIQFTCFFKGYFRCAQSKTHTQRRSSYIQIDSRSKYRGDTQNKQSAILKTVGGLGKGLQTYRHHNVMSTALLEGMHNRHKNASEANNFHESYVYFMYTRYMFEFHTGKFQSAFWDSTE